MFCDDADFQVNKLRQWRDDFVSHKNERVSLDFESFKQQRPLKQTDIQELISKAHDILNRCGEWYDARTFSLHLPMPQDKDYQFVLESLRVNLSSLDASPASRVSRSY